MVFSLDSFLPLCPFTELMTVMNLRYLCLVSVYIVLLQVDVFIKYIISFCRF